MNACQVLNSGGEGPRYDTAPSLIPSRISMCSHTSGNAINVRIACLGDNLVTKSAPMEYLRGELHFYRSIPPELTHLFPTLVGASEDAGQALPSMTITKASGQNEMRVVFSYARKASLLAHRETTV